MISTRTERALPALLGALILSSAVMSAPDAHALDPKSSAQVSSVTFSSLAYRYSIDDPTAYMGIEDCEDALANDMIVSAKFVALFNLESSAAGTGLPYLDSFYSFDVPSSGGSSPACTDGTGACVEISDDDVDYNGTEATVSLGFDTLTGLTSSADCSSQGIEREYFIRAGILDGAGTTAIPADARIVLDTVRPAAPESFTAIATEDTLQITWTNSNTASGYRVVYSTTSFSGGDFPENIIEANSGVERRDIAISGDSDNTGSASVTLEPGTQIYVGLAAIDKVGNASLIVGPQAIDVIDTIDFWEDYKSRGGSEEGGYCASASPTSPSPMPWTGLIALAGMFMLKRREKKISLATVIATTTLLAATLVASPAAAQDDAQSNIRGSFELKLGGFYPSNIDAETSTDNAAGAFESFYGSDDLIYGEFVYERYLFQKFGKLGLGFHAGYTSKKGDVQSSTDTSESEEEDAVPGETTFRMFPLRGSLFYRYDYSALHHRIPLAPIARVGLDYALWRVLDSNGDVSEANGAKAKGGKFGWHASLGLQFMLDYLDPGSAASFDLNWGVNNSYLFAEYMITRIDDFGRAGFDLSDNIWMFGLSFEY